jgi:hypothetical protein
MKARALAECRRHIRIVNKLANITEEDRARLCDVVFENVPDLEEIEPTELSETFPYVLVRQNRLLQDENRILKSGFLGVMWRILLAVAIRH